MLMVAAIFVLSGFAALIYQVAWQRALFGIYGLMYIQIYNSDVDMW